MQNNKVVNHKLPRVGTYSISEKFRYRIYNPKIKPNACIVNNHRGFLAINDAKANSIQIFFFRLLKSNGNG